MKTIALEVPESLLWQTGASREEVKRRAQFLLALKLFEVGQITSGQAALLSGQSRVAFLLEASQNGVPVADLDEDEIAEEVAQAKCV
jgi:predicted HTH domain antitoxin